MSFIHLILHSDFMLFFHDHIISILFEESLNLLKLFLILKLDVVPELGLQLRKDFLQGFICLLFAHYLNSNQKCIIIKISILEDKNFYALMALLHFLCLSRIRFRLLVLEVGLLLILLVLNNHKDYDLEQSINQQMIFLFFCAILLLLTSLKQVQKVCTFFYSSQLSFWVFYKLILAGQFNQSCLQFKLVLIFLNDNLKKTCLQGKNHSCFLILFFISFISLNFCQNLIDIFAKFAYYLETSQFRLQLLQESDYILLFVYLIILIVHVSKTIDQSFGLAYYLFNTFIFFDLQGKFCMFFLVKIFPQIHFFFRLFTELLNLILVISLSSRFLYVLFPQCKGGSTPKVTYGKVEQGSSIFPKGQHCNFQQLVYKQLDIYAQDHSSCYNYIGLKNRRCCPYVQQLEKHHSNPQVFQNYNHTFVVETLSMDLSDVKEQDNKKNEKKEDKRKCL